MFKLNVLIAENNRPSLNLYRDILTKMGHRVELAARGEAAWEAFCRGTFHVVLVDYKLPEIGGDEFFARVKQMAPDVDVVLLTGNNSIDKILALVEKGVSDYLVKPVNPRRLRDMFERLALKQKLLFEGTSLVDQLDDLPAVDGTVAPVPGPTYPAGDYGQPAAPYPSGEYGQPLAYPSGEYGQAAPYPSGDYGQVGQPYPLHQQPAPGYPAGAGYQTEADAEVARLRVHMKALEERLVEAEYREARSRELSVRVQELEQERDMLRRETDRLRTEVQAAAGADEMTRELAAKVQRQAEDLESLESQVASRTRELEDLEKSRTRIKEALEREKDRVAAKQADLDQAVHDLEHTREELRALRAGGAPGSATDDAEIQRLRTECERLERAVAAAEAARDEALRAVEDPAAQRRIEELTAELATLRDGAPDADGLQRKIDDLDKSRAKLMAALQKERETVAAGQSEIHRLQGELDELRERFDGSSPADSAALAETTRKLDEQNKQLRAARDEVASLTAATTAREEAVTYLKRKLKGRSEKYKVLKEAAQVLETDNSRLDAEAKKRAAEADELRISLDQQRKKVEQLSRELAVRDERVQKLVKELDEHEDDVLKVRTEALQSGKEIIRNTELRLKRVIDGLKTEVETLKDVIDDKDTALSEAETTAADLRSSMRQNEERFTLEKQKLEEELADLREVLADREQILRQSVTEREEEFRAQLAQREEELDAARRSGQAETVRLEEELQELRRSQRQRELQDELQSEWMELGEALVLLDEELKKKEAELQELKEEFTKNQRTYETTIANQRRKYKELEERFAELESTAAAPSAPMSSTAPSTVRPTAAFPAGESLRSELAGLRCAQVTLTEDGVMLDFNKEFQECLAMDDTRRPGGTSLHEVPGAKLLRPLWLRVVQGEEETLERPLYIRAPGHEPKAYWGIATRRQSEGRVIFVLELFDLSRRPEVMSRCDFSDARIAFDNSDTIYRRTLKITEALFSMRIVIEILIKKFKADIEIRSMVSDVLKELDELIKIVDEL